MYGAYLALRHGLDTDLHDRIQAFKAERKGSKLADTNVMDERPD